MLPEMWFVYDRTEGSFITFLSEAEAQADYEVRIAQINAEVGGGEYEGDEMIEMGRILKRAEVVPVGINEDDGKEFFSLESCDVENPAKLRVTVENRLGQRDTKTGRSVTLTPEALSVDGKPWMQRSSQMMTMEVVEVA